MKANLETLHKAYILLEVNYTDTSHVIRRKYRTLVKKWHPDKWMHDLDQQKTATRNIQAITNAYQLIKHAPLRYHISTHPRWQKEKSPENGTTSGSGWTPGQQPTHKHKRNEYYEPHCYIRNDLLEDILRLSTGAVVGVISAWLAFDMFLNWKGEKLYIAYFGMAAVTSVSTLICGNRFWFNVLDFIVPDFEPNHYSIGNIFRIILEIFR